MKEEYKVVTEQDKENIVEPLDGQKSDVEMPKPQKCNLTVDDFVVKKDGN